MSTETEDKLKALISCGIIKKELQFLIKKNNWRLKPIFLNSSLHIDFDKLWNTLSKSLEKNTRNNLVCYGTCHPLMNKLMDETNSKRTPVQNCVDLILGHDKFIEELQQGAFFLFEDWALNWDKIACAVFGDNPLWVKEIYTSEHKYLLCIRTPCSNNFKKQAELVSEKTGLPLKWVDAGLENLEKTIEELIA